MENIEKRIVELQEELTVLQEIEQRLSVLYKQLEVKEGQLLLLQEKVQKEELDVEKAKQKSILDWFVVQEGKAKKIQRESEEYLQAFDELKEAESDLETLEFEIKILAEKSQLKASKEKELNRLILEHSYANLPPAARHRLHAIQAEENKLREVHTSIQEAYHLITQTKQLIRSSNIKNKELFKIKGKEQNINLLIASKTDIHNTINRICSQLSMKEIPTLQRQVKAFVNDADSFIDITTTIKTNPQVLKKLSYKMELFKMIQLPIIMQKDLHEMAKHLLVIQDNVEELLLQITKEKRTLLY